VSKNPLFNAIGSVLNPFGAVGAAVNQTVLAKQGADAGMKALVKSLTPDLPAIPGTVDPNDPRVEAEQEAAAARERKARGRSSTMFTQPGAALPDANVLKRTLMGQ